MSKSNFILTLFDILSFLIRKSDTFWRYPKPSCKRRRKTQHAKWLKICIGLSTSFVRCMYILYICRYKYRYNTTWLIWRRMMNQYYFADTCGFLSQIVTMFCILRTCKFHQSSIISVELLSILRSIYL